MCQEPLLIGRKPVFLITGLIKTYKRQERDSIVLPKWHTAVAVSLVDVLFVAVDKGSFEVAVVIVASVVPFVLRILPSNVTRLVQLQQEFGRRVDSLFENVVLWTSVP